MSHAAPSPVPAPTTATGDALVNTGGAGLGLRLEVVHEAHFGIGEEIPYLVLIHREVGVGHLYAPVPHRPCGREDDQRGPRQLRPFHGPAGEKLVQQMRKFFLLR